jgi:hypothetical protein
MKKLLFILIPLLLAVGLSAVSFDITGEYQVRAAMYNDASLDDDGHLDNRLRIGLDSEFHRDLKLRLTTEASDTQWSKGRRGGIEIGKYIRLTEAYLDFQIPAIYATLRAGQLSWKDRMSIIFDAYFPGAMLSNSFGDSFHTELIWMKLIENTAEVRDDGDVFVLHAVTDKYMPIGAYLFYGNYPELDIQNITFMPYISIEKGALSLDAAYYESKQTEKGTDAHSRGFATKTNLDLNAVKLGVDFLIAGLDSHTFISPWYQNGLYVYGNGKYHDGLNLYWDNHIKEDANLMASIVAKLNVPLSQNLSFFAAIGQISVMSADINTFWDFDGAGGTEVNAGFDGTIIPDLLSLQVYGAYGMYDKIKNYGVEVPESGNKNYAVGSTLQITF